MSQPDPTTVPTTPPSDTAAAARSRILGRKVKLADKLVLVSQWSEQLPPTTRTIPGGEVETGNVLVIELTGGKRAELLQAAADNGKIELKRIYPDLVIHSAHHPETRELLFEDTDRDALLEDSGSAIETVATLAGKLSGLDDAAGKRAEGN